MTHPELSATVNEKAAIAIAATVLASFNLLSFFISARGLAFAEPGGFPAFYNAGRLCRFDLAHLYSRHMQDVFHPGNNGVGYFFHLPYEALVFALLSRLPQFSAFLVWSLFSLGCLLASAWILRQRFPQFNVLVGIAFAPVLNQLSDGQDSALILLISVLAFVLFLRERDFFAGAVLALAWFKFPLILPLALIVSLRNRRFAAGFCAVSIAILLLCYQLIGLQGFTDYVHLTRSTDLFEAPPILTNLRGVLGMLTGREQTWLTLLLSLALVGGVALWRLSRTALFCIGIVVAQLTAWHSHFYDAVLLLIPLAWMCENQVRWLRWSALFALCTTPLLLLIPQQRYLLAVMMLAFLAALAATRSGRLAIAPAPAESACLPYPA